MCWLAIHLPDLPLEIYTRGLQRPIPLAVRSSAADQRVLLCNPLAATQGVRPGLPVGLARLLSPRLRVLPSRPQEEQAALERLALWAGRFTSHVSVALPQALLLEVGRSLSLFGGAPSLWQRVRRELRRLGYQARCCIAPTPRGALMLACEGKEKVIADLSAMRAALAGLPLTALLPEGRSLQVLRGMGLRELAGLLRLPRNDLKARVGAQTLLRLQQALGETADLWPAFEPPPRFSARLELPGEVETAGALLFAARRLIIELTGFLEARCLGTRRLEWRLLHGAGDYTPCDLGLRVPQRDGQRLLGLLRERLERTVLPGPVRALVLEVRDVQPVDGRVQALFPERPERGGDEHQYLLERLQARLGLQAVQGIRAVADYRPERAWAACAPGAGTSQGSYPCRPLWLLPQPLLLAERQGWPYRGGKLELGAERERIETGWWDGREVARDYFVARTPRGERLWVFRELGGHRRWFLHGWFA